MSSTRPPPDPRCLLVPESVGHAVVAIDLDGTVFLWNKAAEDLYGWSAEDAIGRLLTELVVPDLMQDLAEEILIHLRTGLSWSGVFTSRRKDNTTFSALVTDTALMSPDGELVGIVGASIDVGEVMRPLLQGTHEAALVTDLKGAIRFAAPAITGLTGWRVHELAGESWWNLVHPDDLSVVQAAHAATAATKLLLPPVELRVRCADGEWLWVDMSATNLLSEPMVRGVLVTLRDITERRSATEELTRRALHDDLTGLANRSAFAEHLERHVAARTHGGALLYLDLDDFKAVNDRFGHVAGDVVLRAVADRLRAAVRPEDICGRLGGDEFALLCRNISDEALARDLVWRVEAAVSAPVLLGDSVVIPTASVGVALLADLDDADAAIHRADEDMYVAKRVRYTDEDRPTG